MPKVKLSNGQILNFPEGMDKEQIRMAIQKKYPIEDKSPNKQEFKNEHIPNKQTAYEKYSNVMNPKSTDSQGDPMVDTIIGKLPRNVPELKIGTPENEEFTKEAVNSAPFLPGIKALTDIPRNLTLKAIAKKITEEKSKEKLYHTTQYNRIFKKASDLGLGKVKVNKNELGLDKLKKAKVNSKYRDVLEDLVSNPTIENAQKAQSDLGKLINSPQFNKDVLLSSEDAAKNAAINAQKHIKDIMFRNEKGIVNKELKDHYNKISDSYGKNYKPYDIKPIRKYEKGKMTEKQLITRLKNMDFMAEKGHMHPEIERRGNAIEILKHLGVPTGLGAGLAGGTWLLNKLLGKED